MAGVSITIRPDGADETLRFLRDAVERTDDAYPLFDSIGAAMVASTQKRFEDEQDPDGNPWPDSLRKILEGGRTLTVRGAAGLVGSITHEATSGSVAIGTNEPHGRAHQEGMTIRAKTPAGLRFRAPGNGGWVMKHSVTLPRRAFLGLDHEDEASIVNIVSSWLLDGEADERP